jgi:hypothetical protein
VSGSAVLDLALSLAAIEILSFLLLVKYGFVFPEFPYISPRVIDQFQSFDPELGWCPQANYAKTGAGGVMPNAMSGDSSYSIDATGSRTTIDEVRDAPHLMSTYGDSFCFCRESADADTWQNAVARAWGVKVSNFGAGNYGMDQALLRLKRNYPAFPTPIVVLAVTPYTFERIISVWKHYAEPGNVLAVKPRYVVKHGRLAFVSTPVTDKSQFHNLADLKDSFHRWDGNFPSFRRRYSFKALNSVFLFSSGPRLRYVSLLSLRSLCRTLRITALDQWLRRKIFDSNVLIREQQQYLQSLATRDDVADLFMRLVGEFVAYAKQQAFVPVFMMMTDLPNIQHLDREGHYYRSLIDQLRERHPELRVVDHYPNLKDRADLSSFFVPSFWHYSKRGNELVAETVMRTLSDHAPDRAVPA